MGLVMPGSPVATPTTPNKQLYNGGSEWQNDYGSLPDLQQTFYRNYDAALGRWIAVDPVAESAESMTDYQYAGNNPIMMNDPLGDKLPSEGSGITLDWTTNATPYSPHHSIFGSGISGDLLSQGEMSVGSGNGYSSAWNSILANTGYYVLPNGQVVKGDGANGTYYTFGTDGKLYSAVSNGENYDQYERFVASTNGGFREQISPADGLALLKQAGSIHVDVTNSTGVGEAAFIGAAALSTGWTADGLDPEPVSKVIGAVGMTLYTGYVLYQNRAYLANSAVSLYNKMTAEIDRIAQKAKGPQGVAYALVAKYPGLYPNVRGGTTFLNAGDVWKFGQTTDPQGRYSDKYLGGAGLEQINMFQGNQMEIRIQEKIMIYGYFMEHGTLPAGNSIFR
ncbi:RHS repeat-associated core domain-containing protein [Mucilaginibacter sp. UC70_90]